MDGWELEEFGSYGDSSELSPRGDLEAATWETNPVHLERTRAIAGGIRQLVPLSREMRAMEVGCGTGLLSFALHGDVGSVLATDPSQGMIGVLEDHLRERGIDNITAMRLDLAADPLPKGPFQLVFLQMALHHIPDVDGFLRTARELLDPGGWLCVADLDTEDGSFHGMGTEGVHLGFDRSDLVHHVEDTGFQALDISTVFEIRKEVQGTERRFPIFLLVARRD
jgi:2-polyprenyl-3-methyl-5-hydroxy-6-metoxy-1,4-benzoquinol methylase